MSTADHLEQFLKRGLAAQRAVADLVRDPPPGRDPADLMTMQTVLAVLTMSKNLRAKVDDADRPTAADEQLRHDAQAEQLEAQARQLLRDAIGST